MVIHSVSAPENHFSLSVYRYSLAAQEFHHDVDAAQVLLELLFPDGHIEVAQGALIYQGPVDLLWVGCPTVTK
jgi:hypothetical protein